MTLLCHYLTDTFADLPHFIRGTLPFLSFLPAIPRLPGRQTLVLLARLWALGYFPTISRPPSLSEREEALYGGTVIGYHHVKEA